MRKTDVIVIGAGFAGLIAAAAAAQRGKKVTLLAKGVGTLAFGSGVIDVLGYHAGKIVTNPLAAMSELPANHPYSLMGSDTLKQAVDFFLELVRQEGYPFTGAANTTTWLPTAAGTLKHSCLVPLSMDAAGLEAADEIVIVGFAGVKDFYPQLVITGLSQSKRFSQPVKQVVVETNLPAGRDLTLLDIARWLDTAAGRQSFIAQLHKTIKTGTWLLVPPVLGAQPSYAVWKELETTLGCRVREMAAPPPAITGSRLRSLLLRYIKQLGVSVIEQANVTRAVCADGKCLAVVTANVDRERTYEAEHFILAAGGILGGGLVAVPGAVTEPIFNLPVSLPAGAEWGKAQLFAADGQPFARIGIRVDSCLRPVDDQGNIVLSNVRVVGSMLAGYDYPLEKCGNGVALASGYYAAMNI